MDGLLRARPRRLAGVLVPRRDAGDAALERAGVVRPRGRAVSGRRIHPSRRHLAEASPGRWGRVTDHSETTAVRPYNGN